MAPDITRPLGPSRYSPVQRYHPSGSPQSPAIDLGTSQVQCRMFVQQSVWLILHDHVGISQLNHPFGNGLYQLSMVIWGVVYYCYTNITWYYPSCFSNIAIEYGRSTYSNSQFSPFKSWCSIVLLVCQRAHHFLILAWVVHDSSMEISYHCISLVPCDVGMTHMLHDFGIVHGTPQLQTAADHQYQTMTRTYFFAP